MTLITTTPTGQSVFLNKACQLQPAKEGTAQSWIKSTFGCPTPSTRGSLSTWLQTLPAPGNRAMWEEHLDKPISNALICTYPHSSHASGRPMTHPWHYLGVKSNSSCTRTNTFLWQLLGVQKRILKRYCLCCVFQLGLP